jgi:hypothetical protein
MSNNHEPSVWAREQFAELGRRLVDERTKPCPHLSDPERDRYAYALWAPAAISCGDCVEPILNMQRTACDRCGERPPTADHQAQPAEGVLMLFALCEECDRREMGR